VPADVALLDAVEVCRSRRVPAVWRALTAFDRDPLRWTRFGVALCTTTGGSSLEPADVDELPPAVCAELSALHMFKAIVLTAPRHTSLDHLFETLTDISPIHKHDRGNV
jgi:hypothetical protein